MYRGVGASSVRRIAELISSALEGTVSSTTAAAMRSPPCGRARAGVPVARRAAAPDRLQVRRRRARVELIEHAIAARILAQLRHAALRILQVPEHDGLRRAGLLACSHDLAVGDD